MRILLVVLLCIFSVDGNASQENRPDLSEGHQAIYFPQKFHIDGNKIVNERGCQVILRGVNALDPFAQATWGEEALGTWGASYYRKMREFGSGIVRIPVHPGSWRDTARRLEILDQTIKWIGDQGMYAIIDYHAIGFLPEGEYEENIYKTTMQEIIEFWQTIAKRYAYNNVVAFYDIFNEPVNLNRSSQNYDSSQSRIDWAKWKAQAEIIVDAIRTVDGDAVIIVGGMNWSYDLSQVLVNPIRRGNIIYGVHPYPGKADYLNWVKAFGSVAKRYPVFAGEIGFWNKSEIKQHLATFDGQADADTWNPVYFEESYKPGVYREEIISFLNTNNIGWTAWSFSSSWGPVLLKNWGYDLSRSGVFFNQQLLRQ